jgi:predicted RNA-binding Zn ribbon-like protein
VNEGRWSVTGEATIPPAARLVRDFVNTYEPQIGHESLTDPERLRDWLVDRRLLTATASLKRDDLARARQLREGLRSLLLGHAGHPVTASALETLNRVLAQVPVRLAFADDRPHLFPVRDAGKPALAGLIDALHQCGQDESWTRLKVCARDTCRWAFYDASRNQSRRWCSMAGCGNHVKMRRAYLSRKNRKAGGRQR